MSGVNKVIIVGRLGGEPEVKAISPNQTVARFSVATSENWTDKMGNKQERTEWHRIVVWGKLAEICGKYLQKGRQVYIEGRLQTRQWDDSSGQKRYTTEVIANTVQFLGPTNQTVTADRTSANTSSFPDFEAEGFQDFGPEPSLADDQVPF